MRSCSFCLFSYKGSIQIQVFELSSALVWLGKESVWDLYKQKESLESEKKKEAFTYHKWKFNYILYIGILIHVIKSYIQIYFSLFFPLPFNYNN